MVRLVPAQPQQKQNKIGYVWCNHESEENLRTCTSNKKTKQNPTFNLDKWISQMSKNKLFFQRRSA